MMPRCGLIFAASLLALGLTGCNPATKMVGKWDVSGGQGSAKATAAAVLLQAAKFQAEFKGDGNCTFTASIFGQAQAEHGSWRFVEAEGNTLVLMVKMAKTEKEDEVRVEFTDNDHCAMVPPKTVGGTGDEKLTFTRGKSS